ncbi:MAG: DUF5939 domain-containing protein [Balneolaceae bacterium]
MTENQHSNLLQSGEVRALRKESRRLEKTVHCRHSAEQLWPYFSQVDMYNKTGGSSAVEYEVIPNLESSSVVRGTSKKLGLTMRYKELPYEWVQPHFVHAEMFFEKGPFLYTRIRGEHLREEQGVCYSIDYVPRSRFGLGGLIARAILKKFVAVFEGIDERLPESFDDPLGAKGFEQRNKSTLKQANDLAERWQHLAEDAVVPDNLADFIATAPDTLVGRMRPYGLARQLGTTRSETLRFCCRAAKEGFLQKSWDLICPGCGGAKSRSNELSELGPEAHCEVCNIRYNTDIEKNVELSFRPEKKVRQLDEQEYCLQSPSHQLQILAQVNVEPGSEYRLPLSLQPGHYRLRCIGLTGEAHFDCAYGRQKQEITIPVGSEISHGEVECGSSIELIFKNDGPNWRTVRFEHHGYREDAATAAEVLKLPEFRGSFGDQVSLPQF